jgi:histidinol-phosphatase
MPDYLDDLRLAHVLADAADAATMDRFKALDLKVETKPDMTPVSEADKAAEELIRGQLQRARPRDAILGEEYGIEGTGPRRWVIDPIDGTKNYVRGVPVWATLISLMEAAEGGYQPVVGVVSAPALGRREGPRRLQRPQSLVGEPPARLPCLEALGRLLRVLLAERLGGAGTARRFPRPHP